MISPQEYALLSCFIEEECGIALGDDKGYLVETRLSKLMHEHGCDTFAQFWVLLRHNRGGTLCESVIDAITTNETLWFRDKHPFLILRDVILPEMAREILAGRRRSCRIWSAASATGQEPYSIGMVIQEFCRNHSGVSPGAFEVLATDISHNALRHAERGCYDKFAMGRGLSDEMRDRYFEGDGNAWRISESLKKMICFRHTNLIRLPPANEEYDIVFLRYVAIYFSDLARERLYGDIALRLKSTGYLFIGATESLYRLGTPFQAKEHENGYYYTL